MEWAYAFFCYDHKDITGRIKPINEERPRAGAFLFLFD